MKILMFARKTLLEFWRSPQLFWLYLLFPAMMVLIYYSAFGVNTGMANYLTVLVDNQDNGQLGAEFVEYLKAAEFDGKPVFTVIELDSRAQGEIMLNEGRASAFLTLPVDFSQSLLELGIEPANVELLGDPLSDTFAFAQSFSTGLLHAFSDRVTGWDQPLPLASEFLPNTGTLNDFQVGVPGLVIFGVLFGVITIAILLTRERSAGTLSRIRLSPAESYHFLGGIFLATLLLSLLQMLVTFAVAELVGFVPVGSLLLAVLIGVLAGVCATGAGLIAAVFSKNEGEATGFGTALMVPLVFLSGAVFPFPATEIFKIFGQSISWSHIMPSTFAAHAMSQVVLYGAGVKESAFDLIMLAFFSFLWLAIGIWLYQRRVLRKMD